MNRRDLLAFGSVSLAATALTPFSAFAQSKYPERPIKLMIAFSAGGVNDVVGRQWADRVRTLLGTVYVENQGGGTGTIATGEVARAQPDGYTILLGSTSTMVLNPMTMAKVPYDADQGLHAGRHPLRLHHVDRGACRRCRPRPSRSSSPTPRPMPASCRTAPPAPARCRTSRASCSSSSPA